MQDLKKLPGEDDVRAWLNHSPPSFYRTRITTRYQELQADASRDPEPVSIVFTGLTDSILGYLVAILESGESPAPPQVLTDACLVEANGNYAPKPRLPGDKIMKLAREESLERFLLLVCERHLGESHQERVQRLEGAFHQPYRGNVHEWLRDAIRVYEKQYNPDQHYGRVIHVIQSSGTGKSRLVEELGHAYPTLSICVREDSHLTSGWPPRDTPVVRYFRSQAYYGEELAAAFLGALMQYVSETLPVDGDPTASAKKLMADWAISVNGNPQRYSRQERFQHVKENAERLLANSKALLEIKRMWMTRLGYAPAAAVSADAHSASDDSRPVENSISWHGFLFDEFCTEPYKRLKIALERHSCSRFFLAFDECAALGQSTSSDGSPTKGMSSIALRRILKAGDRGWNQAWNKDDFTVWYLLLDTDPRMVQVAPRGPVPASSRLVRNTRPLPAWLYMGFNQVAKHMMMSRQQPSTPREALEVKFLKRYGRPCWSTLVDNKVIGIAHEKLFDVDDGSPTAFNPKAVDHVFAAFSHRVPLEIGQNEASMRIAADAVDRHMRILTAVVNDILVTEAPSEPALALASARVLNVSPEVYKEAFNTLLVRLVQQGIVMDRGHQGELCSLLLLMLARDMAAHNRGGFFDDVRNPQRVRAITQWDFLSTLLGPRLEAQVGARGLKAFGAKRWINFTHVIQLDQCLDEIPLTLLWDAWQVGAMLSCAHNQPVIDGFWPEYVGNLDEPMKLENFRYGVYQSNAKGQAASPVLVSRLLGPFLAHDSPSGTCTRFKEEHVVLLMDLGANAYFSDNKERLNVEHRPASPPPPSPGSWEGYADPSKAETEPSRYCINIRGHASAEYPVFERISELEQTFDQLFNSSILAGSAGFTTFQEKSQTSLDPIKLTPHVFDMEDLEVAVLDS